MHTQVSSTVTNTSGNSGKMEIPSEGLVNLTKNFAQGLGEITIFHGSFF